MAFKKLNIYNLLCFFGGLVFFAPVALLVRTQAGVSESAFFLLQALLSCVIFLGEVPAGFVTDRIGYKNSLIVSQVLLLLARVLLLLAYLRHSMALFIAEAVVEAVSACFASGTGGAYLYEVYDRDEYLTRSARCANFGTAGFIVSTIAYAVLFRAFRITGLLAATVLAGAVSAVLSFFLKREPKRAEAAQKPQKPALRRSLRILTRKRAVFFIALSSIFSVAGILITFFYAEKLQSCGASASGSPPSSSSIRPSRCSPRRSSGG